MPNRPSYEELERRVKELEKEATARRTAERALRESEERFRKLFTFSPVGTALIDLEGRYLEVNEAYAKILGISKKTLLWNEGAEPIEKDGWRITHQEDLKEVLAKGVTEGMRKLQIRDKDVVVSYVNTLLYDREKKPVAIISMIQDRTAQLHAEEVLAEERNLLRTVIDNVPDLIYIKDTESRYLVCNSAFVRFRGATTQQEVVGKTVFELFPKELASQYHADDQEVIRSGKALLNREERSIDERRKQTEKGIWLLTTKVPLQDSSGKIVGLVGIARDITEKKRAEEELRESEEKYRDLVENINEVIYTIDKDGVMTYISPAIESVLGYSPSEITGRPFAEFVHQEDLPLMKNRFNEIISGHEEPVEYRLLNKSGEIRWIRTSSKPTYEGNRVTGVKGVLMDITEQKKIEESMNLLSTAVKTSIDAISVASPVDGKLMFCNESFLKWWKVEGDYRNLTYQDCFDANSDVLTKVAQDTVAGGWAGELKARAMNSQTFPVLVTSSPVDDKDGNTIGLLAIFKDITQQKRLEAKLQHAQKIEALGTLAGGIAHNFNNLLMGIQGNTSLMLLEADSSHPNYERLKSIEKSVQRGSRLTLQLLGYAQEGRYELKPLSLNQLVKETSSTFGEARKEIKIHRALATDLWGINADQGQIEQALLNLYVNAADAMAGGGDLFLKTINVTHESMSDRPYRVKPGDYVLLRIGDTGAGMDTDTMERIFDPFFTTKGVGMGTGLGLASVYGIVKAHGGYIDVESESDQGTTFSIYLPASEGTVVEEKESATEVTMGTGTVLLVDDEEMIIEVGEQMLKKIGYTVFSAQSGKEAIELYREHNDTIDLVILDMIMPDMGGGETYDHMKQINSDTKVLLSSGYSIDGQAKEILDRGCDGFIQKPFNMKELSRAVEEVLGKK